MAPCLSPGPSSTPLKSESRAVLPTPSPPFPPPAGRQLPGRHTRPRQITVGAKKPDWAEEEVELK